MVTYNGAKWIQKCLLSLRQSSYPVSVVVIDNASQDDTIATIRKDFSEVLLLIEKTNLGFGQANNKGISIALQQGADYIFLLNQDAYVEENTIDTLVATEFENGGYGVLSPLHVNGAGHNLDRGFRNCISKDVSVQTLSDIENGKSQKGIFAVSFINAAAWLVSKRALMEVGGFNPLLFHYGEDMEYCLRLRYHQLKVGFASSCRIIHDRDDREQSPFFADYEKLTWYYEVGTRARLLDVSHTFIICLIHLMFWSLKECTFHLFKGRWFAIGSWFEVWRRNLTEIGSIFQGRKLLKSNKRFLFLSVS